MVKVSAKHDESKCNDKNYERECPIMDIHDRLNESYFHITEMAENYHVPALFRYSLNAFLSSLQSIKYLIKKLADSNPDVKKIFDLYLKVFSEDESFIKRMIDARNIVIHESNLRMRSTAKLGVFRWRTHKLAIEIPIKDIFLDSAQLLNVYKKDFVGKKAKLMFLDDAHSSIGEEFGIWREWIVDDIEDKEIMSVCLLAHDYFANIVGKIHKLYGKTLSISSIKNEYFLKSQILIESDLDPSLHAKWGWESIR